MTSHPYQGLLSVVSQEYVAPALAARALLEAAVGRPAPAPRGMISGSDPMELALPIRHAKRKVARGLSEGLTDNDRIAGLRARQAAQALRDQDERDAAAERAAGQRYSTVTTGQSKPHQQPARPREEQRSATAQARGASDLTAIFGGYKHDLIVPVDEPQQKLLGPAPPQPQQQQQQPRKPGPSLRDAVYRAARADISRDRWKTGALVGGGAAVIGAGLWVRERRKRKRAEAASQLAQVAEEKLLEIRGTAPGAGGVGRPASFISRAGARPYQVGVLSAWKPLADKMRPAKPFVQLLGGRIKTRIKPRGLPEGGLGARKEPLRLQ